MVDNALDKILIDVLGITDTEYMAWRGCDLYKVWEDEVSITQFKDECLEENTVVNLRTQEQCDEFSKWLDSKGKIWINDERYTNKSEWCRYEENTCYRPSEGVYAAVDWYKDNKSILSYEEALLSTPSIKKIKKEITKEIEAIKLLPTDVLIVMLYNHVQSDEQLLEGFFEQVEDELKFRLDDYDDLCWAMAEDIVEEWLKDNL